MFWLDLEMKVRYANSKRQEFVQLDCCSVGVLHLSTLSGPWEPLPTTPSPRPFPGDCSLECCRHRWVLPAWEDGEHEGHSALLSVCFPSPSSLSRSLAVLGFAHSALCGSSPWLWCTHLSCLVLIRILVHFYCCRNIDIHNLYIYFHKHVQPFFGFITVIQFLALPVFKCSRVKFHSH